MWRIACKERSPGLLLFISRLTDRRMLAKQAATARSEVWPEREGAGSVPGPPDGYNKKQICLVCGLHSLYIKICHFIRKELENFSGQNTKPLPGNFDFFSDLLTTSHLKSSGSENADYAYELSILTVRNDIRWSMFTKFWDGPIWPKRHLKATLTEWTKP